MIPDHLPGIFICILSGNAPTLVLVPLYLPLKEKGFSAHCLLWLKDGQCRQLTLNTITSVSWLAITMEKNPDMSTSLWPSWIKLFCL